MADIILKDRDGTDIEYSGVSTVRLLSEDGSFADFTEKESGSGNFGAVSKAINFYDIYGNIIHSYTRAEMAELTELPEAPEVPGYVFERWSWSLAELQTCSAFADVGAMYKKEGANVTALLVVNVDEGLTLPVYFGSSSPMSIQIDWGDGTTSSTTITGTTATSNNRSLSHKYSIKGTVIIGISGTYSGSYTRGTLYLGNYTSSNRSSRYGVIGGTATGFNYRLLAVATSTKVCMAAGCFYQDYKLRYLCIASGAYEYYSPYQCYALETFACHVVNFYTNRFYQCYALKRLSCGNNMTTNVLAYNYGMTDLLFKGSYAPNMGTLYMTNLILTSTAVLDRGSTSLVTNNGLRIYVNDDMVETYKANSKWSTYAAYIHPLSEYPDY